METCNDVPFSFRRLCRLSPELMTLPPCAKECVVAMCKVPSLDETYGHEAALYFSEAAWGRPLVMRVHGRDEQNCMMATLYDGTNCITALMVEAGLIRVDKKNARVRPHQKDVFDVLVSAQEVARKSRRCQWQYGDIDSDEEEAPSAWRR